MNEHPDATHTAKREGYVCFPDAAHTAKSDMFALLSILCLIKNEF